MLSQRIVSKVAGSWNCGVAAPWLSRVLVPGSQDAASDGWSQNGKTEFDETIQRQVRGAWIYKTNQQKDNDSDQCILETYEMTKTMANTNKFQEHSKERS